MRKDQAKRCIAAGFGEGRQGPADRVEVDDSDLPLVPPARLAVLLTAKRRESGLDLVDLARRSDQRFPPSVLDRIEKGQVELDESTLRALVDLYGLNAAMNLPKRSKLILDLDAGEIGVGDRALPFESSTTDVVLERYVSLLYLLRNEKPGRQLSLRDDDLDVLGSTLDLTVSDLTSELAAIMAASHVDAGSSRFSRRVTIGAAGLLVGVTTVGSLIIVGMPGGSDAPAEPVASGDTTSISVAASHDGIQRVAPAATTARLSGTDTGKIVLASVRSEVTPVATASPVVEVATAAEATPVAEISAVPEAIPTPEPTATPEVTPVAEAAPVEEVVAAAPAGASIDLAAIEAYVGRDLDGLVPGWTIEIAGDRPGYRGLTSRSSRTISVHVDPGASVASVAETLAHEMGHAIDLDHLDDDARMQWVEMRGIPHVWWAGEGLNDFAVGAGDFAEGVAAYLTGSPSHSVYGGFTAEQLAFVGQFIG